MVYVRCANDCCCESCIQDKLVLFLLKSGQQGEKNAEIRTSKKRELRDSGHEKNGKNQDSGLKYPGVLPVFFLKAIYMADRDLNPESEPTPSMERWLLFLSFKISSAFSTL